MSYDGTTWDESTPDNNSLVNEGDDSIRDVKSGVSTRMRHEHGWPPSQTSTAQGGYHTFLTLSGQTGAPSLVYGAVTTQLAAIWASSGSKAVFITDSAGNSYALMNSGKGIAFLGGTGAVGDIAYVASGGVPTSLVSSTANTVLISNGATTAPSYAALSALIAITSGVVSHGATIPLPSGYAESQCKWVVGLGNLGTYNGGDGTNLQQIRCSVDGSRVLTCTGITRDNSTITGSANYIIIGTK